MELQFPLQGIDKGRTTSQQPKLTSPDIKNMRPYDTLDNRARGGQRPGLNKRYSQQIGGAGGLPIKALSSVTVVSDNFEDAIYESFTTGDDEAQGFYGIIWDAQTFTPSTSHRITKIEIYGSRSNNPIGDLIVSIQGVDSNNHPDGNDLATGYILASTISASLAWISISLGSGIILNASTKYAIVARVPDGDGSNKISWRRDTADNYASGNFEYSGNSGDTWSAINGDLLFREYGLAVTVVPDVNYSKKLVVIANNELWYESSAGTMEELDAANGDFETLYALSVFELDQKLFIVNRQHLKIADFGNVKLHTTDIVPTDKVYPRHGTVIEGTTSEAKMVVDYITDLDGDTYIYGQRITTETFQNGDVCTATIDEGDVSFTLDAAEVAGPHWYDWTTYGNAAGDDTTYGSLPDKATIGCNYLGRATLSGDPEYPHQWYMMRAGNPFDAVYGLDDAQSAVAGNDADAGEIGDIVRALIPRKDDYLVYGCVNTMWYLIGDPCSGGEIIELDLTTGMYGSEAWCFDSDGNFYFWGTNGLYRSKLPTKPICISEIRLPKLVADEAINPTTHRITLHYDRLRAGIVVAITKISDGTNSNYWYDLRALDEAGIGGFFPEEYPEECAIYCGYYYEAQNPSYRKLIVGCNDGYLRFFDDSAIDDILGDDTVEAINAYVTFGPIAMNEKSKQTGKLTGLDCVLAGGGLSGGSQSDSDDITYDMWVANSAAKILEYLAADSSPKIAGTFTAPGRRKGSIVRKKIKGMFAGIKLQNNTETETWAFEKLMADFKPSGRLK